MNLKDLYQRKNDFFLTISPTARGGLLFLIVIGLATFIAGMAMGEQLRTWGSLLFNGLFLFGIAVGGVAFGHMQDTIGALWGRPIKRIHESFVGFLPIAAALFIFFFASVKMNFLGAGKVYKWIADPSIIEHFEGKNVWLQPNFMMVRDILALIGILLLSRWHQKLTVGPDQAVLAGQLDEAKKRGEESRQKLRYWSAPVLVLYSLLYSTLAFDMLMSLAPTWFSTLWAGWAFSIMMQTLFASTLLLMFFLKSKPIGQFIGRQQFHDIGKLMFGFTAFYAYLTFAHVLTYWYTNIPEETTYFFTRLKEPWLQFIIVAPFISFLVPFVLLVPKPSKWTGVVTVPICLLILVAQWLNFMLVVIPELVEPSQWSVPWIEFGVFCGVLGSFLLAYTHRVRKIPLLSLGDPLLISALSSKH